MAALDRAMWRGRVGVVDPGAIVVRCWAGVPADTEPPVTSSMRSRPLWPVTAAASHADRGCRRRAATRVGGSVISLVLSGWNWRQSVATTSASMIGRGSAGHRAPARAGAPPAGVHRWCLDAIKRVAERLALGLGVGHRQQHVMTAFAGPLLDTGHRRAVELIPRRHQHTDQLARPRTERSRPGVRPIVQPLRDVGHPLTSGVADRPITRQRPTRGRDRDAGALSDVPQRHRPAAPSNAHGRGDPLRSSCSGGVTHVPTGSSPVAGPA